MFKINKKLPPSQEDTCRYHTRSHFTITETENGSIAKEKNVLSLPKPKKVKTRIEFFFFIGPKVWNTILEELKNTSL